MDRLEEFSKATTYIHQSIKTIDGMAWLAGCAASLICLLDIFFGFNFVPLRNAVNIEKSIALLLFSPLLIFLILVCLRQLPFNQSIFSSWFRAAVCLFVFVKINF